MMANTVNLNRLSIAGLRGISQPLDLQFKKPMTLVYGENGTGKTSICDALDFLGNGECGSLSDISVGSGKHRFWPSIGQDIQDISVTLEASDGSSWNATATGNRVNVASTGSRAVPLVKVWRRKQLMDLILATPANRFQVIEPFIDISEINRSEVAIRRLQADIEQELNRAGIRISESLATLEDQRRLAGADSPEAVEWSRQEIGKSVENLDAELVALASITSNIGVLLETIRQVNELKIELEQNKSNLTDAQDIFNQVQQRVNADNEEILSILESAQLFFHTHENAEACPLCESTENISGLPQLIERKLTELSEIREAKVARDSAIVAHQQKEEQLERTNGRMEQQILGLKEGLKQVEPFEASRQILSELLDQGNDTAILDAAKLNTIKGNIEQRKTGLSEQKGRRDSLQAALDQYDQNVESQAENNILKPKIDRLLEIHETERKRFVDEILSSIAGEVGRLYEEIHPGEGLNQIALQLDPRRRASLDIQSQFLNRQVPPGAYFSSSHLDSLGLCILIALAKLELPEDAILVLDDILGSIDEPHVDRLVQLLYVESQHFMHTLVTTHYHAWHHKIRRGQLRNANCQVIELRKWHEVNGVTTQNSGRPLLEIIRANIHDNPSEIEPIAANAGHLLEQLGDFLVSHYECSVPKKAHGNTLNDYLDGLKPRFIRHLRVEIKQADDTYVEVQLEPLISGLKDIYQVRNTSGAHYNELASHLPPADVLRFGELVVELGDALICAENGYPTRMKDGEYWVTSGETRRLHPLHRP